MKKINILERTKLTYSIRESFKTLRTNLLFSGSDVKTVLLTSCVSNEGKSTVSLELAKSLAASDKKVLLLDTDLRKSVFVTRYTDCIDSVLGLSEFLSSQASLEDVLYETNIENLHVISAGAVPPNPVELLGSKKFEEFLHQMREKYDYVLIDASPLGLVIDASVISAFCDGAVLIIAADEISYKFAADVKEQLQKSNCKILGAILNRVQVKTSKYYSKYYGQKYGRYGYYMHNENANEIVDTAVSEDEKI